MVLKKCLFSSASSSCSYFSVRRLRTSDSQGEKSACASRTEKVHRAWAEAHGVPFRGKRKAVLQSRDKVEGKKTERRSEAISPPLTLKDKAMGFATIFNCRRIVLKVFLLQFVAFQATYAAPSPIIRFPGDDTPKTDKEVALVSLGMLFDPKIFGFYQLNQQVVRVLIDWLIDWLLVVVSPSALSE